MKPPLCLDYPKRYTAAHIGSHWVPVNHLCPDSVDIDSRGFGTCSWGHENREKNVQHVFFHDCFSNMFFFLDILNLDARSSLHFPIFPTKVGTAAEGSGGAEKTCSQQICGKCPSSLLVNLRGKLGKMGTMAMARILQQFVHF